MKKAGLARIKVEILCLLAVEGNRIIQKQYLERASLESR